MKQQHEWKTEWDGHYPCFCSGKWHLFKDGEEVDLEEVGCPFAQGTHQRPAGTYGEYAQWLFDHNWSEHWVYYRSGLGCKAWCRANAEWLKKLDAPFDWRAIYKAFRENDWRPGQCGGCI